MAGNSNALGIDVYLPPEYDSKPIADLKRVANNIVELDLSGLPIGAEEMDLVAACTNLEWLELDKTPIDDTDMEKLANLKNLSLLKVYGTSITDKSLFVFKNLPQLKRLYLWETGFSPSAIEDLRLAKPSLLLNNGIDAETREYFVANDSITEIKGK